MLKFIDPKFSHNIKQYLFQSFLAFLFSFLLLLTFGTITEAAIVASIGSTIFIVFALPSAATAKKRNIIGGYLIGTFSGLTMSFLIKHLTFLGDTFTTVLFASLAIGLSIFLMVIFDAEHPPASGIALGLAVQHYNEWTILFVLGSALILAGTKKILKKHLIDLI